MAGRYVAKLIIGDEFSLLLQQCWDEDAILGSCHICIITHKDETTGKEGNKAWRKCNDINELWDLIPSLIT